MHLLLKISLNSVSTSLILLPSVVFTIYLILLLYAFNQLVQFKNKNHHKISIEGLFQRIGMYSKALTDFNEIPTKQHQRSCTDVLCTIIGILFSLIIFIMALVFMNKQNYFLANYPTDSDGIPCAYGDNRFYSYLYFPDVNNLNQRVCVSACPTVSDTELQCRPNKAVPTCLSVDIYESSTDFHRLGGFCAPTDQKAKELLAKTAGLQAKWVFLNAYDAIRLSLAFSALIGILWIVAVQIIPSFIPVITIYLAALVLLCVALILLIDNPRAWQGYQIWKILIAVACLVFAIFLIGFQFMHKKANKVSGIFLKYSALFLTQKIIVVAFIPVFILLSLGLIVLCIFQYLAFTTHGTPYPVQGDIYLHTNRIIPLEILVGIQFVWGMQFLKDSFDFMVSGNSAEWQIYRGPSSDCCVPVSRYFRCHFGSVVGGSFLNAFFNLFSFIFEAFRCEKQGSCNNFAPVCQACYNFCGCFFYLVRTDVYAYLNLTGVPYCNSARNCEQLCQKTNLFNGRQSGVFYYRLCAHIFCIGLVICLGYWMMKGKVGNISLVGLLLIMILSYSVSTYFIDIHTDAAEGIQISYLLESELKGNKEGVQGDGIYEQLKGLEKGYDRL